MVCKFIDKNSDKEAVNVLEESKEEQQIVSEMQGSDKTDKTEDGGVRRKEIESNEGNLKGDTVSDKQESELQEVEKPVEADSGGMQKTGQTEDGVEMIEQSELNESEKTEQVDSDIKESEQDVCKINEGASVKKEIEEFEKTMDLHLKKVVQKERIIEKRESEIQDVGVAGGGNMERNDNCKTKCDRNVTFDEYVDVCETKNMTIESCTQLDDTLSIDDEPLEIAEKMIQKCKQLLLLQDTDDADDPTDKISGVTFR